MKSIASVRLRAGLIAFALVLSQVVMPVQSAFANQGVGPAGNNGTLKVHEAGTASGTESNDPKVCGFNFEGFGFDVGQTGYIQIEGQGQTTASYGDFAFGPTVVAAAHGSYAESQYFNVAGGTSIADGHYKATLYGKDGNGAIDLSDDKAKSKVFKVKCSGASVVIPAQPQSVDVCNPEGVTSNVAWTSPLSADTDTIDWSESNAGATRTATLIDSLDSWADGTKTPRVYNLPADNGIACDKALPLPTPLSTDPCGPQNVSWATQAVSAEYTWSVASGRLIVTANVGFYFVVNGQPVSSYDFGSPVDSNQLCPTVAPCTESAGSMIVSKDTQFADRQDTRTKGHYSFTNDGLKIYTEDTSSESKVAWYKNVNYPLAEVGTPSMDYSSTSGITPGLQIEVDFDNDGSVDGILVGESVYGDDWWLSNGSKAFVKAGAPNTGGGYGSLWYGTLSEWYASFQTAQVKGVGFSLGSGVKAEGVLKSLTFGCYTWIFKRVASVCTVSNKMYDRVWNYDGDAYPEAGASPSGTPGSFDFQNEGLYLNTPNIESYVSGFIDGGNTPLADVDAMSYKVLRQAKSAGFASTLPAYILLVDTNGLSVAGGEKYFFYEPYYNDQTRAAVEGTFQTWDAFSNGTAKWYMSGTGQTLKTWSSFVSQFPDAVVVAYGFNQGTYNAETYSVVQDVVFDCATTTFRYFQGNGGGGGDPTPEVPVTPVTPTPTPVVVQGNGGAGELPAELPMTGTGGTIATWFALLAAILTYGAVFMLQPKKQIEE